MDIAENFSKLTVLETDDQDLMYYTSIDTATKEWMRYLLHNWQIFKRCSSVIASLTVFFETAPNPYLSVLRILVNLPGFMHIKTTSLAFTVLEEFSKWIECREKDYGEHLTQDLKIAVFRLIIKQNNIEFVNLAANTYKFVEHKMEFLPLIQKMISEKKYDKATQYAIILQLQDSFENPETLMLPLILQNKLTIVEKFLSKCPTLQRKLLLYLDNLISPKNDMQMQLQHFISMYNIPNVKKWTTEVKPMTKLIARFAKIYDLPPELYVNVNRTRCAGALQHLMHKRYVECSLSTDSWREMVEERVGGDQMLQLALIKKLIIVQDAAEGLYWAKKFNIPKDMWPWSIKYEEQMNQFLEMNDGASTSKVNEWERDVVNEKYHKLKLSRDSIKVVDNPETFKEFLDFGLKNVHIVGIDSEWKPSIGVKQEKLAIIQIATATNVYILDVMTMGNESAELWSELALILFENKNILKLGFGIVQDMTIISNSLPELGKIKTPALGYIDIVHLWQKLLDYNFIFPYTGDTSFAKKSLSVLVELCLGAKLNKSDQFSNWERRPLREDQIVYAALDAYCLLEIYTILKEQCNRLGIPFHDVCYMVQHTNNLPEWNTKKQTQKAHKNGRSQLNKAGQQNRYRSMCKEQQKKPGVQNDHTGTSVCDGNYRQNKQKH